MKSKKLIHLKLFRNLLAPWDDVPEHWRGREQELEKFVRKISTNEKLFRVKFDSYSFDKEYYKKVSQAVINLDSNLQKMRIKLVPYRFEFFNF